MSIRYQIRSDRIQTCRSKFVIFFFLFETNVAENPINHLGNRRPKISYIYVHACVCVCVQLRLDSSYHSAGGV